MESYTNTRLSSFLHKKISIVYATVKGAIKHSAHFHYSSKYNLNRQNASSPENWILWDVDTESFQDQNEIFKYS